MVFSSFLLSFSTNLSCQLNIFWLDGNALSMYSAQVQIFQQLYQVHFCCLLLCHHHSWCHSKPHTKSLQNLMNQVLKWELMYQQFCGFLVSPYLSVQPFWASTYATDSVPMLCLTGSWVAFFAKVDCFLPTSSFLAVHLVLAMLSRQLLKLK